MSGFACDMSDAEREIREALAFYKKILIESHQPTIWDALGLAFGRQRAKEKKREVQAKLSNARETAMNIVNKTTALSPAGS